MGVRHNEPDGINRTSLSLIVLLLLRKIPFSLLNLLSSLPFDTWCERHVSSLQKSECFWQPSLTYQQNSETLVKTLQRLILSYSFLGGNYVAFPQLEQNAPLIFFPQTHLVKGLALICFVSIL